MTIMIDLLVNYNEFWTRLSEDIRSARRSVFVQTFAFEGDAVRSAIVGRFAFIKRHGQARARRFFYPRGPQ